jgi:hypothetical protein
MEILSCDHFGHETGDETLCASLDDGSTFCWGSGWDWERIAKDSAPWYLLSPGAALPSLSTRANGNLLDTKSAWGYLPALPGLRPEQLRTYAGFMCALFQAPSGGQDLRCLGCASFLLGNASGYVLPPYCQVDFGNAQASFLGVSPLVKATAGNMVLLSSGRLDSRACVVIEDPRFFVTPPKLVHQCFGTSVGTWEYGGIDLIEQYEGNPAEVPPESSYVAPMINSTGAYVDEVNFFQGTL